VEKRIVAVHHASGKRGEGEGIGQGEGRADMHVIIPEKVLRRRPYIDNWGQYL
jgi:hypothetical protein